jgi:hypothetical protein
MLGPWSSRTNFISPNFQTCKFSSTILTIFFRVLRAIFPVLFLYVVSHLISLKINSPRKCAKVFILNLTEEAFSLICFWCTTLQLLGLYKYKTCWASFPHRQNGIFLASYTSISHFFYLIQSFHNPQIWYIEHHIVATSFLPSFSQTFSKNKIN